MNHLPLLASLLVCAITATGHGDDRAVADALRTAGAEKIEQDRTGTVTSVFFKDSSKLTPGEWKLVGQLAGVKTLTFYNHCTLTDDTLALLDGLTSLEKIATDGATLSDKGLATMAKWKNLRTLTFFHCSWGNKAFTGAGLAALADLPRFESFSIGGSHFTDEGMAALAKLTRLKEVRIWHTFETASSGVHFESLQSLTTLRYGPFDSRATVAAIPHIAKLKSLEKLALMETRLTAAGLEPLKHLANLKSLELEKVEISPADLSAIKAALPKVEVKWTEPDEKALGIIRKAFDRTAK